MQLRAVEAVVHLFGGVVVEKAVFGVEIGDGKRTARRHVADQLPEEARGVGNVVQGHAAVNEVVVAVKPGGLFGSAEVEVQRCDVGDGACGDLFAKHPEHFARAVHGGQLKAVRRDAGRYEARSAAEFECIRGLAHRHMRDDRAGDRIGKRRANGVGIPLGSFVIEAPGIGPVLFAHRCSAVMRFIGNRQQ